MESRNSDFTADLHCHLYGALDPEDLLWLYRRKTPRYHIWTKSLESNLARKVTESDLDRIFQDPEKSPIYESLLEEYYYLTECKNFDEFQGRFDLVIALSHTDPEELEYISDSVIRRSPADFTEYRMFLPSRYSDKEYAERLGALTGVFHANKRKAGLVISLPRTGSEALRLYGCLLEYIRTDPVRSECIRGIDISGREEGSPPSSLGLFLRKFSEDRACGLHDLKLLYHAGESFRDKTPESAVRWIYEAADAGADRIGHALALGLDPQLFRGQIRTESTEERKAQTEFERIHYDELRKLGYESAAIEPFYNAERKAYEVSYDEARIRNLNAVQELTINKLKGRSTVIESCPSSNLRIAGLCSPALHPLKRFVNSGIRTVIGSDDPGILKTDILKEFAAVSQWEGIDASVIRMLREEAYRIARD